MRQLTCKPLASLEEKDKYSTSIIDTLHSLFDRAIQEKFSDIDESPVLLTNSKLADYQCNSAISIAQVIH